VSVFHNASQFKRDILSHHGRHVLTSHHALKHNIFGIHLLKLREEEGGKWRVAVFKILL